MGKTSAAGAAKSAPSKNGRRYGDILYEVKDQVAWVTINRPRVLNAFREQTLDEMIDALKSTRDDPSIACAVVTGAGDKAFSAGGDFYAMKRLNWTNAAMWNDRMQGLAMTIRGLPIPVIAMVNGWCMGGGHELALWCDLVIASENAVLGPDRRQGRRLPDGRRDAVPAAHHRRAARARDDLLRPPLHRQGGGRDRPHQQVRAAEGPLEGDARVVRDHQGSQPADAAHDQEEPQFRIRPALCVVAARHGAARRTCGARKKASKA